MNRREASKLETHKLIISAAKKLFLEKKVEQCTMRNIAKEAGVSAASIVVHFENKQALMEIILGENIERITNKAIRTLPSEGNLAERLAHVWQTMYAFYDTNRNLYRTLTQYTLFEPEDKTPFLTRHTKILLSFLQDLIDQEKTNDRVISSTDVKILAHCLFMIYFNVLIKFYRNPDMPPQQATDLVFAMTQQTLIGIVMN
ncbi:MAG: TetR/AcrR family transcriptional regulator [Desulfobacteraceae bacterium]